MVRFILWTSIALCAHPALSRADWVQDGGALNNDPARNAKEPSLAIHNGTPYVAWVETDAASQDLLIVKHYDGAVWVQDGLALNMNTVSPACWPKLAFNGDTPYVAWNEFENQVDFKYYVYVKHYNGAAWVQDGGTLTLTPSNVAGIIGLAFPNGVPYVAWLENFLSIGQIYVKHFNGSAWVQDGTINNNSAYNAVAPSLAVSGLTPYIAWMEDNGTARQVYVKYYNGAAWVQVGTSLNIDTTLDAYTPSLAFAGATPYVVWNERAADGKYRLYAKHYNGAAWVQDGGVINVDSALNVITPGLAFDGTTPYAVWKETDGTNTYIYVKHYDGTAWVRDGSALSFGDTTNASYPNLAFDGTRPYVAWQEMEGTVKQIHVKHYVPPTPTPTSTVTPTPSRTAPVTFTPTATLTPTLTPQPEASRGAVIPNPFMPKFGRRVHFNYGLDALGKPFTIRILNLRGRIVRTLRGEAEWDGRDDAGGRCEGGVYLYQIEAEGRRYGGTLSLIGE